MGNLDDKINKKGKLTEKVARLYFRQIISALEYCHEIASVIHRDIKPENLLINEKDEIKMADFGVSSMIENGQDELSGNAGSNFYMSPEACQGSKFKGKGSDIWAVGVTLYYMVEATLPFFSTNFPDLFQKIKTEEPEYSKEISEDLTDLL
mmetsp:Transcript_19697/g.18761  ORF Transcript_19697/g.18761 Transcript_19697/m.18761 type:complete len:151 (+) Transcript_19697:1845-2297(+)